jgi:transposase
MEHRPENLEDVVNLIYHPMLIHLKQSGKISKDLENEIDKIMQIRDKQHMMSSIFKFIRSNDNVILKDKANIFSPFIQDIHLSQIIQANQSKPINISKDFFKESLAQKSQKLLITGDPVCVETELSNSNKYSFSVSQNVQHPNSPTNVCTYFPVEGEIVKANRKEKRRTKKIKTVKLEENPRQCQFLLKMRNKYYRPCGARLISEETNCSLHTGIASPIGKIWPYLCDAVISQNQGDDRSRSRKGLKCLVACSEGETRCRSHKLRADHSFTSDRVEALGNESIIRCFKVRMKLNKNQRKLINLFAGCVRKTYNWALETEGQHCEKTFFELRDKYVTNSNLPEDKAFLKQCPKQAREASIRQLFDTYTKAKYKRTKNAEHYEKLKINYEERVKHYEFCKKSGRYCGRPPTPPKQRRLPVIKFKTRRGPQTLEIAKECAKICEDGIEIYPTYFGKDKLLHVTNRVKKRDHKFGDLKKDGIKHNITLQHIISGKYYMCIPYDSAINKSPKPKYDAIALDKGCRKFLTTFDTAGRFTKIGEGFTTKIDNLRKKIADLKRERSKYYTEEIRNAENKIANIVNDLHYKTISYFLKDYANIFSPTMNVTQMISGHLRSKTKHHLSDLRFGQFQSRLISKVEVYGNGRTVHKCNESRTSKTCCRCFKMDQHLGSSETYKCKNCGNTMDRDMNAAVNILIKYVDSIN